MALSSADDGQGLSTAGTGGAARQPAATPLASINKSMTNREIVVQAMIANIRAPSSERAPHIVTLTQDGATASLVFWSDISPALTTKVKDGNLIRAKVTVGEYRGRLQLRLQKAANLEVVSVPAAATGSEPAGTATEPPAAAQTAPAPAPRVPPAKAAIGAIKADWADRVVTISGTIAATDNIGSGQRIHVQDRTGEIQVVVWENVLGEHAVTELQPGRVITVTGPVKLYRGATEIVPEAAGDVKLAPQ